MGKLQ